MRGRNVLRRFDLLIQYGVLRRVDREFLSDFRRNKAVKFNSGQYISDTLEGGPWAPILGGGHFTGAARSWEYTVMVSISIEFKATHSFEVVCVTTYKNIESKVWTKRAKLITKLFVFFFKWAQFWNSCHKLPTRHVEICVVLWMEGKIWYFHVIYQYILQCYCYICGYNQNRASMW